MTDDFEELERERVALLTAEQHIANGEARISRHEDLLAELIIRGSDAREALALMDLLRANLEQWKVHRKLIVARIEVIENALRAGI